MWEEFGEIAAVGEPFTQITLHAVWATRDRLSLLQGESQAAVYECIQAECARMKVELLAIGGIEDHIHVLTRGESACVSSAFMVHDWASVPR
jgi:REP element-mobilizing transposase RayT